MKTKRWSKFAGETQTITIIIIIIIIVLLITKTGITDKIWRRLT